MKENKCPAYAQTQDVRYRCFLTGSDCRIENYEICGFYKENFARQKANDGKINSQSSRVGNPAMAIVDAIDHMDRSISRDITRKLGEALMYGDLQ